MIKPQDENIAPNNVRNDDVELIGYGNNGVYFLHKRISTRVGRKIGVKLQKLYSSASNNPDTGAFEIQTSHQNIFEEAILQQMTHKRIQEAKQRGTLLYWIDSVGLIGTPERALKRGAVYKEHAEGINAEIFFEDLRRKKESKTQAFFNYLLQQIWCDLYKNHIDAHLCWENVIINPYAEADILRYIASNRFNSDPFECFVFSQNAKLFVNIDPIGWKVQDDNGKEIFYGRSHA